jgi:hypothetical protein
VVNGSNMYERSKNEWLSGSVVMKCTTCLQISLYLQPTHFDHDDGGCMRIRNVGNIASSTENKSSRTDLLAIFTITIFLIFLTQSGSRSCLPPLQSYLRSYSHLIIVLQTPTTNKNYTDYTGLH